MQNRLLLGMQVVDEIFRTQRLGDFCDRQHQIQMVMHRGSGIMCAATFQRINDRLVLIDNTVHTTGDRQSQLTVAINLRLGLLDYWPHTGKAGNIGQRLVEYLVSVMKALHVVGFNAGMLIGKNLLEPQDVFRRDLRRRFFDDDNFQRGSHEHGLFELVKRNPRDKGPDTLNDLNQAFFGQALNCLMHRGATDAVLCGDIALDDSRSRQQGHVNDALAQVEIDPL